LIDILQNILFDLLKNDTVPKEFYNYWYDLINTTWYLWKLLLLNSAIESLVPKWENKKLFRIKLLWDELANELFETWDKWLRHRLTHWEYFNFTDFQKNYVDVVHWKIIQYFNNEVLSNEHKLTLDIISPQRHPFWNYVHQWVFLKSKNIDNFSLDLKSILNNIPNNELNKIKSYECLDKITNF